MMFNLSPGAERNYSVLNRNKYGIAVDMRKPEGREIFRKLAAMSVIILRLSRRGS